MRIIISNKISRIANQYNKSLYTTAKYEFNLRLNIGGASIQSRHVIHTSSRALHMKRKEPSSEGQTGAAKRSRPRLEVPEYHLSPSVIDNVTGNAVWPAPEAQMQRARDIILEWYAQLQTCPFRVFISGYINMFVQCPFAETNHDSTRQGCRWTMLGRNLAPHSKIARVGTRANPCPSLEQRSDCSPPR
jgi:hypothetical protein